ncbi:MAG TPA: hypothetical protein VFG61_03800 [Gaiellaceae bacterium]|jgi:hypothetical protein|nr:hypothetical protein [Gaiellaceae bacterium]
MADDWRVTIDFDDEGDGTQLAEWLAAVDLEGEERSSLGERVIVSRDGPRVYLYADSEEPAREVLRTVSARIEQEGQAAFTVLERWHPVEQAWKDGSIPLPTGPEELEEEHERLQDREAAESAETGAAQWEVRIELASHEDTVTLAERLESEGIPVVRRHTFLLAGAANEDDARELAERIRGEAPEGAKVDVEAGGGMVWEVAPRNPFTFFGGLGG